jgi:hypothetical protein
LEGLPPPEAGNTTTPLAFIQVALAASLLPEEGIIRVEAQLTPASYVLSRDCRLTGGFAFYAWLKGTNASELVATLGGYYPKFPAPPGYPQPPRVGLNWPIDQHLQVKGDLYCALTPVAMMAGGHLEVTFHDGGIHAWFKAGVDFLIAWKPYHYTAQVDIDVAGSYTFDFIGTHTITIDVGAGTLRLPPTTLPIATSGRCRQNPSASSGSTASGSRL